MKSSATETNYGNSATFWHENEDGIIEEAITIGKTQDGLTLQQGKRHINVTGNNLDSFIAALRKVHKMKFK